jgi:hypothetical protein
MAHQPSLAVLVTFDFWFLASFGFFGFWHHFFGFWHSFFLLLSLVSEKLGSRLCGGSSHTAPFHSV